MGLKAWAIGGVVLIAAILAVLTILSTPHPPTHQTLVVTHAPDHEGQALNVTLGELIALHPDWDAWLVEARTNGETRHTVPVETVATFWEALPAVDRQRIIRVGDETYRWGVITI